MTPCPACAGKGSKSLAPEAVGFYRFVICDFCRGRGRVSASHCAAWRLTQMFAADD